MAPMLVPIVVDAQSIPWNSLQKFLLREASALAAVH